MATVKFCLEALSDLLGLTDFGVSITKIVFDEINRCGTMWLDGDNLDDGEVTLVFKTSIDDGRRLPFPPIPRKHTVLQEIVHK